MDYKIKKPYNAAQCDFAGGSFNLKNEFIICVKNKTGVFSTSPPRSVG